MGFDNSNNILNVSMGGGDDLLSDDTTLDSNTEAYTVVLSVAVHVLSMIFGGGSSIAVIIAITTHRNINRYSYTLVLAFFFACCCLNFIWSPLEVIDLMMFHYSKRHPCDLFVTTRTSLYLFLVMSFGIIIVLLSVEGIIRMRNRFGRQLRKFWPMTSSILALVCSLFITGIFIRECLQSEENVNTHYIITDSYIRSIILALTVTVCCMVAITLVILLILFMKEAVYWEDGRPHLKQKRLKLEIPEFLISQSNACADDDGGFESSRSGTPSPTTPTLLTVGDPDTSSIKGEDSSHISDLPNANIVKPTGNRLGINMAQVLGRRRHTICQISDSNSVSTTPADPMDRAKQYNYVRKFSVDISALQAQLQNPKIFRDAPYQSDIDLSRKPSSDVSKSPVSKPLLPLNSLTGKFDEKDEKRVDKEKRGDEFVRTCTNNQPPPVITVSNDDAPSSSDEEEEEDVLNEIRGSQEKFHEDNKHNDKARNTPTQKPTMLNFNEATEDHNSAPTLESAASGPSDTGSEGLKMARLTMMMSLAFVINMLPVVVTEILESRLSRHAFINIFTCTVAVSTLQTMVYPRMLVTCDDVVRRAIRKLKIRVENFFICRSKRNVHNQGEDSSSSTDQL